MITASSTCAKHLGTTPAAQHRNPPWMGCHGKQKGIGKIFAAVSILFCRLPLGEEPFLAERKGCLYCPISRSSKPLFFHHLVEENPLIRNI